MKVKMLVFDIGKININGIKNVHLKIRKKRPLIPDLIASVLDKPLHLGYNKLKNIYIYIQNTGFSHWKRSDMKCEKPLC